MSEQSRRQTTEQRRATEAWRCIDIASQKSDTFKKRYGSLACNLAALIQVNGLGQTLAFVHAKAKMADRDRKDAEFANEAIFNDLSKWVKKELGRESTNGNLLQLLMDESSSFYRQATVEAMALVVWLRRFAEASLPKEEE